MTCSKTFGVIGDPIEHSLSPAMHNAAYEYLRMQHKYVLFHVKPENLPAAIQGIRALNISGVNVTIPHKVKCMELLDEVSDVAYRIGAVNTILNVGGRLYGHNTDGYGFIKALEEEGHTMHGASVAILGTGGAAKSVAISSADGGASKIAIFGRNESSRKALALSLESSCSCPIETLPWGQWQQFSQFDIVVNATPIGMKGVGGCPVPDGVLRSGQKVYDLVYTPRMTPFLQIATGRQCEVISGMGMLVHQGSRAFKLFTGEDAPGSIMKEALTKALLLP